MSKVFIPSCRMASTFALHFCLALCILLLSVRVMSNHLPTLYLSPLFFYQNLLGIITFHAIFYSISFWHFNDQNSFPTHWNISAAALGRKSPHAQPVIRGLLIDQDGCFHPNVLIWHLSLIVWGIFRRSRRSFLLLNESRFFWSCSGTIGS